MPSIRRISPLLLAGALALPWGLAADDGDSDTSFDSDGRTVVYPVSNSTQASAVVAAPDGSIVVAGGVDSSNGRDAGSVRLTPAGALDATWGSGGWSEVAIDLVPYGYDRVVDLVRLADGSFLLAAVAASDNLNDLSMPVVVKLTPDGDLDGTFGVGGIRTYTLPWTTTDFWWETAIHQADGKLIFFGYCYDCPDNEGEARPMLLRVRTDGAPDTTFSGDGFAVPTTGAWSGVYPYSLALDNLGRILVLGQGDEGFSITRLSAAGAIDPTFGGGDGVAPFTMPTGHQNPYVLVVDPVGGGMWVGLSFGSGPYDDFSGVFRLTPSGAVDPSYAGDGLRELVFDDRTWVWSMVLQSDGRLAGIGLIEHGGLSDFFLFRLLADGSLDNSFHDNGARRIDFALSDSYSDFASALTLSGGRMVVAGHASIGDGGDSSFAIARTENSLIFTDGFERGSTAGWGSH